MIPYGRQYIDEKDIDSVLKVLHSDWLTQGPMVDRFERAVSEYCGARYAVAVSNATAALHLACRALSLKLGDSLWTSPNTFVASANCARYCGADVDFVDIDPNTLNICVSQLESKLAAAKISGDLPKVVIPVHFGGHPCEMQRISDLSKEYGFSVVEDASHAIGARYKGDVIGSCRYSAITVFSFHPVKIMTTGEGGMLLTNREDIYEKLLLLRTHGITRREELMTREPHGPWYYEQIDLGSNYRMTDIQAALGVSQLDKVDEFVARRRRLAERYRASLSDLPILCQVTLGHCDPAFHLFPIRINENRTKVSRLEVFRKLREAGIAVNVHYIPVHTQPYYESLGFHRGQFPEAESYYEQAISLPIYYGLSYSDQDRVVAALRRALGY